MLRSGTGSLSLLSIQRLGCKITLDTRFLKPNTIMTKCIFSINIDRNVKEGSKVWVSLFVNWIEAPAQEAIYKAPLPSITLWYLPDVS